MRNYFHLTLILFIFFSCTKEVDSPALLSQIDSLKNQVATLQTQVAAGSDLQNQLNTKTAELTAAEANYAASQSSLSESLEAYSILETAYLDLSAAYDEILDTVSLWFENTEGVYQFYTTVNGVRTGADYLWDLGVTGEDENTFGIPYFDEYYGNGGTCYTKSEDSSLGEDAKVFIEEASFDDLGIIAYDLDASNFTVFDIDQNYDKINQSINIINRANGIYVLITYYDLNFNAIGTIGNLSNSVPNPPLTSAEINAIVLCN